MLAKSRNFGHIIYNYQNCMKIHWSHSLQILTILKSKLTHYRKDGRKKRDVIKSKIKRNFPQKCLFTFKIVRVFVNVWLKLVLSPNLSASRSNDRHERKNRTFGILLHGIESGFALIATTFTLTDGNKELGSGNTGFLRVLNFPWSNYLHEKRFYFKIRKVFFKSLIWAFLLLTLTHCELRSSPDWFLTDSKKHFQFTPLWTNNRTWNLRTIFQGLETADWFLNI